MAVFKQRRGTAAALAAANEIPASGQIIVETDTNRIKIGDGVTRYNALPYSPSVSTASVPGLQAALDGKASVAHTHSSSEITDFSAAVIATAPPTTNASLLTSGTLADARLSTNVVLTSDSRLTDSRSPTAHASSHGSGGSDAISINANQITAGTVAAARLPAYGSITTSGAIGSTANLPVQTGASGVLTTGQFGSTTGTFCAGDDARLSNARTPTAHTHTVSDVTGLQGQLDGKASTADSRLTDARTPTDGSVTTAKLASSLVIDGNVQSLRFRRGTFASFTAANPTPAAGELLYETDTNKAKVGDGFSTYSALPYLVAGGGGGGGGGASAAPSVLLDSLVFNGTSTTYAMQSAGQAVTPANVANVLISLNGVIQRPNVAFTTSGSNITFSVAPAVGDTFFGVVLDGDGAHKHDAADITSGVLSTARLPLASTSSVGVVRVGSGLSIDGGGLLSASPTIATLGDVTINSVSAGNLLRFSDGRWRNAPEVELVDGGNF